MAELDYAFLADYATVEGGRLTAVGASFTHVDAPALPSTFGIAVAGRVRAPEDVESVHVDIAIHAPEDLYVIATSTDVGPTDGTRPYDGKIGLLFAMWTVITIAVPGLYRVDISLDGEHTRSLAFDVSEPSGA